MERSWLYLLLVVLCIQGLQAFSPIPEDSAEEEWDQYYRMLRDPSYRLPATTRPSKYEVTLAPILDIVPDFLPDGEKFTFEGEVTITIQATEENVNQIILHCNDLTIWTLTVHADTAPAVNLAADIVFECEMPRSFLTVNLTTALDINQQYIIKSTFKGNLQDNMRGFYRSWYIDSSGNRRWMATTQFQPGHARQAFPCYDEPGFKAHFDITMIREADFSPTLANMPINDARTYNLTDGRVSETFYTTTKTSTYLVAFIVSHYKRVESGDNQARPFHIYARDNVEDHGLWALEIGEQLLTAMEEYTNFSYYTMADNIIMQQAAIPDFSAGAMENWGLLTYREALVLYDKNNSNHFYKQRVANIVAHEITHMWFGNLVTCAWWDNLWLNEGFARFYTYFLPAMVPAAQDLGFPTRFVVEQVHQALLSDSVDSAHALTNPNVNNPATVSAHFSTITYAKGASILRMTEYLLGEPTFRKALQNYLRNNQYNVAEPQDLFDEFDSAVVEDNAFNSYGGITVTEYMKTWTEKAGHPLLTVAVDHATGRMTVTQERWNVNGIVSGFPGVWHVPITWTRAGAIEFDDLKPTQIITGYATTINRGTTGREWVIFNKQQAGFYRVNYDPVTWALITQALRVSSTRVQIHEYNRAQIVDDVFIMARAGLLSYTEAFNILSFLEGEDQYAPWIAAITGFNYSTRRLAHNTTHTEQLHKLAIQLSTAVSGRLGFAERENESYMDGLLRMYLNTFLCNIGHEECIAAGIQNFALWRNGGFVPANMRPWVYCTGLRYGNADDFNYFWGRYLVEDLASEQVVMLTAAGCTNDEASLGVFLEAITADVEEYIIREQDRSTALSSALTSNEANTMRAFNWLKDNVNRTASVLGSISSPLGTISSRLLNEAQIAEVTTWIVDNRDFIGNSSYNSAVNGIATSRSNIDWYSRRVAEYERYFLNGYEEATFEDDTTTTSSSTTTPPPPPSTTEDPNDSANFMSFSIVTLIVTFALNLAYNNLL